MQKALAVGGVQHGDCIGWPCDRTETCGRSPSPRPRTRRGVL